MYFRTRLLCETLNQYKKIIIYGTGNWAQEIYPQLVEHDLKDKIICFAQTEMKELSFIDDIPVLSINTLNDSKAECVVLVAVSEFYTDEIKQILLDYEYLNIISLVDYRILYKRTEKEFSHLNTFEEYCEYIADWYVKTNIGTDNKQLVFEHLINRGKGDKKIESNLIVVICGHLSPRSVKIIHALKQKKYDIVILSYSDGPNKWCLEELRKEKVKIEKCKCIEEMLYKALQYYPLIYFFEPRWGDCQWAKIMLKNKQSFGKIVIALYDVINDGFAGQAECHLETEKYALEHADGIVWRWFSKEKLEKKGFRYQGKSVQFLDCCNHQGRENVSHDLDNSVLKLCAISGHGDESVENREYSTEYTEWARIEEILAKIGDREDCVFHFYAGCLSDKNIERCDEYEKQYKNFRFFLNTEHDELLRRLEYYDYGCELWTSGKEPPDDYLMGDYSGGVYRDSIRNAYFDFLDAGLPIITTLSEKMWEYLSSYDVVIKMNLSDIDIDYLKQNKIYYKIQVKEARRKLDINNQINKLIQFFKEV